jgi:uncharacterized protein DUF3606
LENSVPDDKTKTRPQDAARVNVHEKYELEYWTKKFGVTPYTHLFRFLNAWYQDGRIVPVLPSE